MNRFVEIQITTPSGTKRFVTARSERVTLGSNACCAVVVDHPAISAHHADLEWQSDHELKFGAVNSSSSLLVDGKRVTSPAIVRHGQQLALGPITLVWRDLPKDQWPTLTSNGERTNERAKVSGELSPELPRKRYELGEEIGRGGMGKVLQASDKAFGRSIALKVLLRPENKEDQARFLREARVTGRLQHPSIVPVHELSADENGSVFYTMKLVKGLTLLEILQSLSRGNSESLLRYPLPALLTIFQKVCDAVAFAHAQPEPVIHRDLKPENIMVGDYGEVLVMDWGSAKILQVTPASHLPRSAGVSPAEEPDQSNRADCLPVPNDSNCAETAGEFLTQTGSIMGTPGFMAPEQARGEAELADARTDIYALGAILYAILTLEAPVRLTTTEALDFDRSHRRGETVNELFRKQTTPLFANENARQKYLHLPGKVLPQSLVAVAGKAMSFSPTDRFASVKDFQRDIAAYQAGFATVAEEANSWRRFQLLVARNKLLFATISALFVILLSATVISLRARRVAIESNQSLQRTLQRASLADLETARQRLRVGATREGLALLGRSLGFWPDNQAAADYLLRSLVVERGDLDKMPRFGVNHDDAVYGADFSPDDRRFATASYDRTARVWDTVTGAEIGEPIQQSSPLSWVRFSPDGSKFVTATENGEVCIWSAASGKLQLGPLRHGANLTESRDPRDHTVETAVFSSDGRQLLTACWDHNAYLWDLETGKEIARLPNPNRVAWAIFSPDGSRILTCYWRAGAIIWDAKTYKPIGIPLTHAKTVRRALFSPDGRRIVTASLDKTARLWDAETGKPLSPPLPHGDYVWSVAVSPDGRFFATASHDKTARLWSLTDGSSVGVPMLHDAPVDTVAFSPDSKLLLTASRDKTARLWDVQTCKQFGEPMRHDNSVLGAIFNHDGTEVLSYGWDRMAYLWQVAPASPPGEILPVPDKVSFAKFIPRSDRLFLVTSAGKAGLWSLGEKRFLSPPFEIGPGRGLTTYDEATARLATTVAKVVSIWDCKRGAKLSQITEKGSATALLFSRDGSSIFIGCDDGSVLHRKVADGALVGAAMPHPRAIYALALSPFGDELATSCAFDEMVRFWDAQTGQLLPRIIRLEYAARSLAYHPSGQFLATGSADHTARIWALKDSKQVGPAFFVNGPVTEVQYLDEGRALLVGGSEDGGLNCYDVQTGAALFPALRHPDGVLQVTASSDASAIVTVTADGKARLWRIPTATVPAPKWFADSLRVVGGLAFSAEQQLVEVPMSERLVLRRKLLALPTDSSVWDSLMRESLQHH